MSIRLSQREAREAGTRRRALTIVRRGVKLQPGDDPPRTFSWRGQPPPLQQISCWITYTNEKTHAIIREVLPRSPLYNKQISDTGPRYCPSIEDKVVRFDTNLTARELDPCSPCRDPP